MVQNMWAGSAPKPNKKKQNWTKTGDIIPSFGPIFVFFYGSVDGYGSPIEKYPDGGSGTSTADTR